MPLEGKLNSADLGIMPCGCMQDELCATHRTNRLKMSKEEVKVVDPKSGGVKASKLARFSLIPFEFLWALAEHYGKGAKKYADRNWEKGYKWSLTLDAMQRHITLFGMGERYDNHKPDCPADCAEHTGSHHIVCAAWHCVALFIFDLRGVGTNDLFKGENEPSSM